MRARRGALRAARDRAGRRDADRSADRNDARSDDRGDVRSDDRAHDRRADPRGGADGADRDRRVDPDGRAGRGRPGSARERGRPVEPRGRGDRRGDRDPPPAPLPVVEASIEEALVAFEAALPAQAEATRREEAVEAAKEEIAPDALDPYLSLLETLSAVASTAGASLAASSIEAQLAGNPVARAWRAILRGESEDFGACPTTLDEWAGATLAALLGAPQKSAQLRRELRARGVAAFGLIEAA